MAYVMDRLLLLSLLLFATVLLKTTSAFENTCNDNIAAYWGQNSYGAANPSNPSGWQKSLRFYCEDDTINAVPISFLTTFFATGGKPSINLANACNSADNSSFPGTDLAKCTSLSDDIKYCQERGKIVTISLGGATAGVGFTSDSQAAEFADTLWNDFLGGQSETRPFGDAVLDGIDLDIEGGGSAHYGVFLERLLTMFKSSPKKFYLTAAPQCVYPDANLQTTMNQIPFDAVYVQFYNNPCGLQTFGQASQWNFGIWDYWARNISPNPNVKIYIGAPASETAAGSGYVNLSTLQEIAVHTRNTFPSFGGVMFWDASQADANNQYHAGVKKVLSQGGGCNTTFVFPACSAPAWVAGQSYTAGSRVSHKYIWEAKWFAASEPTGDAMGEWTPISACSENGTSTIPIVPSIPVSHTSPLSSASNGVSASVPSTLPPTVPSTAVSTAPPTTPSLPPSTPPSSPLPSSTPGQSVSGCADVAEWSATTTYVGGMRVVYQHELWVSKWWTYGEVPGGASGVWEKLGSCSQSVVVPNPGITAAAISMPSKASMSYESASMSSYSGIQTFWMPLPSLSSRSVVAMPSASESAEHSDTDDCDAQTWKMDTPYVSGSIVVHKGTVYKARWWNINVHPGPTGDLPWEIDRTCTARRRIRKKVKMFSLSGKCGHLWSAETEYSKSSIVEHEGYLYQAKANSLRQPPGSTGDWIKLSRCDTV